MAYRDRKDEIIQSGIGQLEVAYNLEFYRLIGEGYKAMQDGRTSTIDEVREKLKKRREERG